MTKRDYGLDRWLITVWAIAILLMMGVVGDMIIDSLDRIEQLLLLWAYELRLRELEAGTILK